MTTHYRHSAMACPACDGPFNCSGTLVGERPPQPGDFTLCVHCGMLLTYHDLGGVRLLTETELAQISPEERADIERTRQHMRAMLEEWK